MKALIFDMDGVIIDSEKVYEQVDQQWFAENGIKTDRIALRQCLGCTDDVNWGMIARWNPELDIAAAFQKYCAFCKDVRVNYEKIYRPYVQALIDQCRRCGILTALASSSPMDNIQTVLCDCQLEGQFDLVVSGCDLPVSKPDPAIYHEAMRRLDHTPAQCVVIEDSAIGIEAAKRAGMYVIAKRENRFHVDQRQADHIADDLLQAWLHIQEHFRLLRF